MHWRGNGLVRRVRTTLVILMGLFFVPLLTACDQTPSSDDLVQKDGPYGLYYKEGSDTPYTGNVEDYYENGTLREKKTYKDGKEEGPSEGYFDNGQLEMKGNSKNGKLEGPYEVYYENGQLWKKGTYKGGLKEGPWVVFTEDGEMYKKDSGTYRNNEKISD